MSVRIYPKMPEFEVGAMLDIKSYLIVEIVWVEIESASRYGDQLSS